MTRMPILVDCSRIANSRCGVGQVACQYARALMAANSELDLRFLAAPRFKDLRRIIGDAAYAAPRFSIKGAIMRPFNRNWRRYYYRGTNHALRHVINNETYPSVADSAPYVVTIHDTHYMNAESARGMQSAMQTLKRVQKNVSRASVVGFISDYSRRSAAEYLDFGDAEQVVIYNGVNKPANPQKPEWFSQLPQSETRPFLFSVARVAPSKNYILMPPMMRHLPGMNLIIAGPKEKHHAPEVEQKARDERVAGRVVLPGFISEGEKAWLLQHCAGFVFPSLREGFGMPVIEAMHFGKAVFCFAETAIPEIGGDYVYYWRDNSPKAMAALIQATLAAETEQAITARLQWAAKYSWQNNAEAYLQIYRRLTGK